MGSSPSPAAVLDSRHSGAPELNHSPRVRDGDGDGDGDGEGGGGGERERESLQRTVWDVSGDPEQRGDLGDICSEAADPSHGRWEDIQPQPFSRGTGTSSPPLTLRGHFLPCAFPSPPPSLW